MHCAGALGVAARVATPAAASRCRRRLPLHGSVRRCLLRHRHRHRCLLRLHGVRPPPHRALSAGGAGVGEVICAIIPHVPRVALDVEEAHCPLLPHLCEEALGALHERFVLVDPPEALGLLGRVLRVVCG